MSKKIIVEHRTVTLYSDDGRTWVSRKRDLRRYRRKVAERIADARAAFAVKELAW